MAVLPQTEGSFCSPGQPVHLFWNTGKRLFLNKMTVRVILL
jgi:hypothetical protein